MTEVSKLTADTAILTKYITARLVGAAYLAMDCIQAVYRDENTSQWVKLNLMGVYLNPEHKYPFLGTPCIIVLYKVIVNMLSYITFPKYSSF